MKARRYQAGRCAPYPTKNGNRTIQFVGPDRKRRSIRLGKVSLKIARDIRVTVESIHTARVQGIPLDIATSSWLRKIGDGLHERLANVALVEPRAGAARIKLGIFLTDYIDSRSDVKPNTKRNLLQSRRYLVEHFGADRELRAITLADADRFGFKMKAEYAEATAARVIKHARQFFTAAHRAELVNADPFAKVKAGSMENRDRMYFVTREDTEKLIAAAPDHHWRLLIALARYAGLRTPSEPLALTWADVDWEKGKVLIRSPKTGNRWIPLFPELRPHLEEAFDAAEPGEVYVITKTRNPGSNFRTTFEKIIYRAGLLPWEKPFQNLRASRETELTQTHPLHVVTEWIGNSALVAARHYLQVTDDDFKRAANAPPHSGAQSGAVSGAINGADTDASTSQNMTVRTQTQTPRGFVHPVASTDIYCTKEHIPLTGVEPVF